MCLIVFAYKFHREYPLIIAANRDEFYDRPSASASFWDDAPHVLAGRDLKEGGTWLGLTTDGRLAAITNYRDPALLKANAPSRGLLISDYLRKSFTPTAYLENVHQHSQDYNGFNLLIGNISSLYHYSNITGKTTPIEPGIHGLSNHLLDTPWPKVVRAKTLLKELLLQLSPPTVEPILFLLADRAHPPENQLPDTGIDHEWERMLSPLFITSPYYGTCSSTVILVDRHHRATFVEKITGEGNMRGTIHRFTFDIELSPISEGDR